MKAVTLLGVPWDEESSFMRGAAAAPAAIRAALRSPSSNLSSEDGSELQFGGNLLDAGDVVVVADDAGGTADAITAAVGARLDAGDTVLVLGGDHAITFPVVRAHAARTPDLAILHLDAHPDLYDDFEGRPFSHASPFARIMEGRLARRLVQAGIRTLNAAQRPQVARFGVEQIGMRDWATGRAFSFDGPVYLSVDLDVLDPAFAPGVSHHEPGGLSVRDLLSVIQSLEGRLVGADVVELNPSRDRDGLTAMVAAKVVKEIAARLLRGGPMR